MTDTATNPILCALVAIPLPITTSAFSYLIPEGFIPKAIPGVRVNVPFRNREITGYIVGTESFASEKKLKPILAILDDQPVLSAKMLKLTKWIGEYYGSSWGEAIENALPRWVKYGKKTAKYIEKAKLKTEVAAEKPQDFTLTVEQQKAFKTIQNELVNKKAKPILIYGVTGSGKSELYIRTIRETLKQNRAAICMVPEIALTEQLQRFFAGQFGDNLEILHSKMTDGERFLAWKRIEMGTCRVVLGPRSAVFAPIPNLGLIIMDEEHEGSYKQETTPRYHAREVAAWRAKHENALFLMGTATPSLETMYMAEQGEVTRMDLTQRIDEKAMPKVEVIDLSRYQGDKRASTMFSPPLMREIDINLKHQEGTMLLLNRRGFSTSIRCPACNTVEQCKMCQVSLTFHQEKNLLLCHYCNYQKKVPEQCSSCKAPLLRFMGFGTEKVESEVARLFPNARIARMDADTTRKKNSHELILEEFRKRKIDILIGTQMIAKGFDFPHVTLVGVVLADVGLRLPDFRSGERTFQLLTQFAGRAGRGEKPGRVYIQTYMADHPAIQFARHHDFLSFYSHEKAARETYHYPPYCSLVNVIIRARDEKKAYVFAREIRDAMKKEFLTSSPDPLTPEPEVMGPAPLPFYKLRGHFRWHVMLKIPQALNLTPRIYALLMGLKKPSAVAFQLDVDPFNIL
ncbi:MAG TPA: primosomal protein N' [Candidatus Omnitrophota bacterium]|nr:primosomal protein N' [Candidatus Omnitrophota bacterium]